MADARDKVELFLAGARVVAGALADPAVAEAWDRPSVLEDQLVSGLAGHLARGAVWVVADYLDADAPPEAANRASAADYFEAMLGVATPADHEAIRARGAQVAEVGPHDLAGLVAERLDELEPRLRSLTGDHLVAVAGGNVLRLDDYLASRIVEQVVHLDDLARSLGRDAWALPPGSIEVAIDVAMDLATRRAGGAAVIRALYRDGFAHEVLPVL